MNPSCNGKLPQNKDVGSTAIVPAGAGPPAALPPLPELEAAAVAAAADIPIRCF